MGIQVRPGDPTILSPEALDFVAKLHRRFDDTRLELLAQRVLRQARFDAGELPDFLDETRAIRTGSWKVAPPPADLQDRRVEITGPVDRKMMINALNSGAKVFMADFEDSHSPTWENVVAGQVNVHDAYRGTIQLETEAKTYNLGEDLATLVLRPRGWHLTESNMTIDEQPVSAALFDFGMAVFHNASHALENNSGPYFYLPKLESHIEARLWNDVFVFTQHQLGLPSGSIRATVLIETILAAFEMDEILFELKDHSAGLNAGRWDYIFSVAKKFAQNPAFVLPDRSDVAMTAPFMRAYTELMVATCHRRGAHAIGGMAAFIPNRRDPEITAAALAKVTEDKRREATDGFDGTWVAHPDLVPVARAEFDAVLGNKPNQVERRRDDVAVTADDLLAVDQSGGAITAQGLRTNVSVGLRYIESWLAGTGAAAIDNLMEDAATAEISRAQIWQWVHHARTLDTGEVIDHALVEAEIDSVLDDLRSELGEDLFLSRGFADARKIFEDVALGDDFTTFLTLPAYELLD
jgi:malate synthase